MANQPAYDLLVLIDADAPEERRTTVLEGIRKQISGGGELKSDVEWGVRKLAFEIAHRGDAYYHLFQLEAQPELLTQLEHSLAIGSGRTSGSARSIRILGVCGNPRGAGGSREFLRRPAGIAPHSHRPTARRIVRVLSPLRHN
jgi:ribosomal protein S6